MFSEHTLTQIRERMNIADLVGEYVSLKKSGQAFQGLCPFHSEKSPSFYVHPLKQVFRCFGCQKGGNVFTFLMHIDGLNFPEAVRKLAERTGVTLEETGSKYAAPADPLKKAAKELAALEWAARYFHYLLNEVEDYAFAREYVQSRGLVPETIERFQIGVAPRGWNTLLRQMTQRKHSLRELVSAGLVVEREGSETGGYDRFRERLMFPIRNREGQVVGFGARALKEGDQPKYLNSPESSLFSKRQLLYGLYESQRGIRQTGEVILVEGYMDVIGLHQAGVTNAVATMGTALTEEHCTALKPLTRRAVTVFDPDNAGKEAWHRSVHMFLGNGFFAKDLSLPDGLDPDDFVRKEGAEKFHALCAAAPRQVTKLLREIARRGPLSESDVAQTLSDLTPLLLASRRLPDRAVLWDDICLVLGVSLPVLTEIAESAYRRATPAQGTSPAQPARPQAGGSRPQAAGGRPAKGALNRVDLGFFAACVEAPEFFLQTPASAWADSLTDPTLKEWMAALALCPDALAFREKLGTLVHSGGPPELAAAAAAAAFDGVASGKTRAEFDALLERLQKRRVENEIRSLSAQVKLTARMGDAEEQLRLLGRLQQLRAQQPEGCPPAAAEHKPDTSRQTTPDGAGLPGPQASPAGGDKRH